MPLVTFVSPLQRKTWSDMKGLVDKVRTTMRVAGNLTGKRVSLANEYLALKVANAEKIVMQFLYGNNSLQTMPQWVAFSTTTFCNLKCPHCNTHGTEGVDAVSNKQYWPHELTLKIAAETLPYAHQFCLTLIGEPLATPRFRELISTLRPYGAKIHVTTNGTLLSKEVLIQLLPLIDRIDISIDGGTKGVVEAIRLGTRFEELVNRIRLLTRSCERLSDLVAPPIRLAFTVMGSNIRDMPEVIRLAKVLGVNGVDFYPLYIFYKHLADEMVELYEPLYNAYFDKTLAEAQRLDINANILLPLFPEVTPDPSFATAGKKLLISTPREYYDSLPDPESYLDQVKIESDAAEVEAAVRANFQKVASLPFLQKLKRRIRLFRIFILEFAKKPETTVPWCEELATKAFIGPNGDVTPCCMPGRPSFGNVHNKTVAEIWNGPQRTAFRKSFLSSIPPDCCKGCRNNIRLSRQRLIARLIVQ